MTKRLKKITELKENKNIFYKLLEGFYFEYY